MQSLPNIKNVHSTFTFYVAKEKIQILLAEDDSAIRRLLQFCLEREGYQVIAVSNGQEALHAFVANPVDLVILDVTMPLLDGWTVCQELRKRTDVPIIMLTAHTHPDDIVRGVNLGADSYITKPFTLKELRARVYALLRRTTHTQPTSIKSVLRCSDITMNEQTKEVSVRGKMVDLSPNEYRVLAHFMHNPDKAISKEELVSVIWAYDHEPLDDLNFIRVTILRLRSKLEENPSTPIYLRTIHGHGYKLCRDVSAAVNAGSRTLPSTISSYT